MMKKIGIPSFRKIWNSNFFNHICIALIFMIIAYKSSYLIRRKKKVRDIYIYECF